MRQSERQTSTARSTGLRSLLANRAMRHRSLSCSCRRSRSPPPPTATESVATIGWMEEGRAEREELLRRQLKVLSADQFEVLLFELAAREESGVRRLKAPDGGADTLRAAM